MNKRLVAVGIFCLAFGVWVGHFVTNMQDKAAQSATPAERQPLFYRNPMNPAVTSPVPTTDSMGMDYIPVYEQEQGHQKGAVSINPVVQNNIGLRTTTAERRTISRTIRAAGRVDYAEDKVVTLHPKVEGWIRNLRVDKTGQHVDRDEILLDIYSPQLLSTQQEYLLALNNYTTLKDSPFADIRRGATSLVESSHARLTLLDVPPHQIKELKETHVIRETLHIQAPATGIVARIGARQGEYVTPQTELFEIVDLRTVWVYADIYEYELPWVKEGDAVELSLKSLPGEVLKGTVAYIYPYSEATTRSTQIRMEFDNTDLLLRPETFVEVRIYSQERTELVVPTEAVVRSGSFDQIFVATESGTFEPRRVTLGIESEGDVAVLQGIEVGERVVVSAQFLIDSESKLQEATAKMVSGKTQQADQTGEGVR
ncbi:Cation efflux system protein CusB [Halioglobus japonicus]|nr:Cation efflux system protein CusB [Halioglobus japonicus]